MKKIRLFSLSMLFILSLSVANASNGEKITKENIHSKTEAEIADRVETLKNRVEEIKAMDRTGMSSTEKRAYKDELKEIHKELKTAGSTVTISIGALIIIILLLILIF